jgi:hypothetical protein
MLTKSGLGGGNLLILAFALVLSCTPSPTEQSAPGEETNGIPPSYIEKAVAIPDLLQSDKSAGFPNGGVAYCAPVAVSNSLLWYDAHGYPNLFEEAASTPGMRVKLAKVLASERYMATRADSGTGHRALVRGVREYVRDRGYTVDGIEYRGMDVKVQEGVARKTVTVDIDWIKRGIIGESAAWIMAGWYTHDPARDEYSRIGGHWLTVVGYGQDAGGNQVPNMLILHDPHPRAGDEFANEHVALEAIPTGTILGYGLPQNATGYHKLTSEMHLRDGADCAILEGAVVLNGLTNHANGTNPTKPSGSQN